ncbi:MAG: biosynthetic arginine decarboxylase [Myxococcales bacterium]|nr:biosynthetic arginine decarboxylase [Myxococcales bacterium]
MHTTAGMPRRWTVADSLEIYNVRSWGGSYFSVNPAGHVVAHPAGPEGAQIDMKELVDEVRKRGIGLPLLVRFPEILRGRIVELNEAFKKAIAEYGYKASYKGVYPIKVNQDRYVVERILEYGRPYHHGLEAGSKPELLAVMAMLDDEEALIVCNGYKDEEYIETALLASKLGRTVIIVVEKLSELELIDQVSKRVGVRPRIGMRAKLAARGAGRWESSGGDRAKFGLSSRELMAAMRYLKEKGLIDCFELLHFHIGSQISAIRSFKTAMREAGRFFVELSTLGAPLKYLDIGGGLGVDYDGSQTNFSSSMNYSLQEYANDVVYATMELCDGANVPHPTIVSESGRAVVAHHAVVVMDILGVSEFDVGKLPDKAPENAAPVVRNLGDTYREVTRKNILESYHDALEYKDECLTLFSLGHLSLEERVLAEEFFWGTCQKILRLVRELAEVPEDLEGLEKALSDTYFCNFSMFQSLPDSWAIDQLFPILPIHRLNEEPSRRAVLADITCDSDGKIDHFIDRRDVKNVLELHPLTGEDYYVGIFLTGAYQEILGDLHNLFGDTNTIHVATAAEHGYQIELVITGDTVTDVLKYVGYSKEDLMARLRRSVEVALRAKRMSLDDSRALLRLYEDGLAGYTYLERD